MSDAARTMKFTILGMKTTVIRLAKLSLEEQRPMAFHFCWRIHANATVHVNDKFVDEKIELQRRG